MMTGSLQTRSGSSQETLGLCLKCVQTFFCYVLLTKKSQDWPRFDKVGAQTLSLGGSIAVHFAAEQVG